MAYTSTFEIDGKRTTNSACFAPFRYYENVRTGKKVIIIEKPKRTIFSILQIKEYLRDLRDMGFVIDVFGYYIESKEIRVTLQENYEGNPGNAIALSMAVRYLWEGRYNVSKYNYGGSNTGVPFDNFTSVVEIYFHIKKLLPENNKLELLCLAHNIALITKQVDNFNSNHYFCYGSGCKIKSELDKFTQVNNYFSRVTEGNNYNNRSKITKMLPESIEDKTLYKTWTKKEVLELLKRLKDE